jgi:F-type H+-transporting ATPase subunit b
MLTRCATSLALRYAYRLLGKQSFLTTLPATARDLRRSLHRTVGITRNTIAFAVTVLSLAPFSLPVWAEEAGAGDKGLPQFDTSLYPEQIFWLVVTFAILYLLMAHVALPRVVRTQENRKAIIAAEIEAARVASEAAKATVAAVEKSLSEARARAQVSVSEMLAAVAAEADAHKAAKEKDLLRQLHRAEEDIAVTREAAMQEVRAAASGLAKSIVGKILGSLERVRA